MKAKNKKLREMQCQEYKYHALNESIDDIQMGRLKLPVDSMSMHKGKVCKGTHAGKGYRQVSKVLEEFYKREFEKYGL